MGRGKSQDSVLPQLGLRQQSWDLLCMGFYPILWSTSPESLQSSPSEFSKVYLLPSRFPIHFPPSFSLPGHESRPQRSTVPLLPGSSICIITHIPLNLLLPLFWLCRGNQTPDVLPAGETEEAEGNQQPWGCNRTKQRNKHFYLFFWLHKSQFPLL